MAGVNRTHRMAENLPPVADTLNSPAPIPICCCWAPCALRLVGHRANFLSLTFLNKREA